MVDYLSTSDRLGRIFWAFEFYHFSDTKRILEYVATEAKTIRDELVLAHVSLYQTRLIKLEQV